MSALAARRAAAATNSASASPVPSSVSYQSSTKTAQPAQTVKTTAKTPRPPPKSPSASSSEAEYAEAISSASTRTPNKRRRIDASPPTKQRYFVQPEVTPRNKSKPRAFSPSAPVDSDQEGDDSSDEEITFKDEEAAIDVDEGTVRWDAGLSAPPTPGPERVERIAVARRGDVGTSNFEVKGGTNVLRVTEAKLKVAAIDGKGPGVLISLADGETLMVAGSYTVLPLQRPLTLFSTILHPGSTTPYPVFAPASHPVPVLEGSATDTASSSPILGAMSLPKSFLTCDGTRPRTVFLLRENRTGLEGMRSGAIPGFNNVWLSESGPWGLKGVHPVVGSFPHPVYPYISPPSWPAALSSLSPSADTDDLAAPVVIVKGPKRTGKSTMARAALNNLLETYHQVAWLECDLGQGEFGCGGIVGLWIIDRPVFGPPFTHPQTPLRAHYLGTYTPLTCPDEYISAIRHLLNVYKYEVQYPTSPSSSSKRSDIVPLVINTQGWVKGLGEDLLRGIEAASCPTHVLAFDYPPLETDDPYPNSPIFNPALLPPDQGGPSEPARVFILDPAPVSPLQARYTSADMRVLSTMTYFHCRLASDPHWDFTAPLAAQRPIQVDVGPGGPLKEIYLIGDGAEAILESDLDLALNGSIVALGRTELAQDTVHVPARSLPPHDEFNILGLALVRGVKRTTTGYTLHLLTPAHLDGANCVVLNGAIELPTCGLLDWREDGKGEKEKLFGAAVEAGEVPFLDSGRAGGVGIIRRRIRRNLQRRNV